MRHTDDIQVSFILATHNRASTLLHCLERVDACGLPRHQYEIWVVDNASTDGTADHLRRFRPDVHLLALPSNRGSCAKSQALPHARGEYIVFLDDDSFPLDDAVEEMIEHFQRDSTLGAAGFITFLPNGGRECSALPNVFIGCGVGFRASALQRAGGLDPSYFMQAEEYDLSFRLARAGFKVLTFENLYVLHLKAEAARSSKQKMYYDVRNNFTLALNYLPRPWLGHYLRDWQQRYRWLAEDADALSEFEEGKLAGYLRGCWRRLTRPQARLNRAVMNSLFGLDKITTQMSGLKSRGCACVLFADLGKNIYSYYQAARAYGVEVLAVMDDRFAAADRCYRGIPLVSVEEGMSLPANAVVISNSSPVHARNTELQLGHRTPLPIYRWHSHFEPFRPAEPG